jgi:hypothetical protein
VERIVSYATDKIDPAANGVAIFACWGAEGFFEAIQLTTPVSDNRVYAYNQPHLYHLARLDEQYPRYAAVLTDTNTARIFVFGLGQVIDAEEVKGKKVHRVKVGGWSQSRYQRRVGNAHQEHAKEVVERLAQIVREDKVSHIILAGDQVVVPLLQEQLPQEMASMVEVMKLDLHASDQDVLTATLAKLQEQEARTAAEKVDRLMQQYRARGLAVVGSQETLEALANGQVEELLISGALEETHPEPEEVEAILAPEIPDSEGGTGERRAKASLRARSTGDESQANRRNRDVYRRRGFTRIDRRSRRIPAVARVNRPLVCLSRSMSKITESNRDHIADEDFAFPKERKEPIHDAAHVRNAIARFKQVQGVTDAERDAAWKRIKSAAKKYKVELNEQDWRELS